MCSCFGSYGGPGRVFADAMCSSEASYFPPGIDTLLLWSQTFRCSGTFQNYCSYVRTACLVVSAPVEVRCLCSTCVAHSLRFCTRCSTIPPLSVPKRQLLSVAAIRRGRGNSFESTCWNGCCSQRVTGRSWRCLVRFFFLRTFSYCGCHLKRCQRYMIRGPWAQSRSLFLRLRVASWFFGSEE